MCVSVKSTRLEAVLWGNQGKPPFQRLAPKKLLGDRSFYPPPTLFRVQGMTSKKSERLRQHVPWRESDLSIAPSSWWFGFVGWRLGAVSQICPLQQAGVQIPKLPNPVQIQTTRFLPPFQMPAFASAFLKRTTIFLFGVDTLPPKAAIGCMGDTEDAKSPTARSS